MKKQMLIFTAGILLGAIISTGVFITLKATESKNHRNYNTQRMSEGKRREKKKNQTTETEQKEESSEEKETNKTT